MTEEATFEQVHPLDRAEYREMFLNVKCGNIPSNKMKMRATNPITKEYDHIECVTIGIVDKKSNEVETIVQTIKNINTEHSVIVDLKSAREQLDLIHKTMKMTIWYYDYETKLFATASQETKPNYIDGVLAVLHPDDVHKFIDFWSPLFNGVKDKQYGVFRRKTKTDNEYRFYEYMCIHYRDENSHKDCIIGYYHDVDEYYKYLGEIENYEHCLNLSQNQIRVAMYNSKDETVRYLGIDSESENSADVMYFMNLMTEESRATAMTIYKAAQQGILGEKTEILHFDSQNAPFHGNLSIAVTVRPFSTTKKNYDKYLLIIRNITDLTDYIQQ